MAYNHHGQASATQPHAGLSVRVRRVGRDSGCGSAHMLASAVRVWHTKRQLRVRAIRVECADEGTPCRSTGQRGQPSRFAWSLVLLWACVVLCGTQVLHVAASTPTVVSSATTGHATADVGAASASHTSALPLDGVGTGSVQGQGDVGLVSGVPAASKVRRHVHSKWPVPVPVPHVLFASIALRGHATPLIRMAREMVLRGYRVSFATNTAGEAWVNTTGADVRAGFASSPVVAVLTLLVWVVGTVCVGR